MKRKLLVLLSLMLCFVLAFSLTSCFGSDSEEEEEIDPKVKEDKWNQYLALDGLNSFTVKVSQGDRTATIKAVGGQFSTDNGHSGSFNSNSLKDFIDEALNIDIDSSCDYSNASFDKKTSSYKLTCSGDHGEYTVNVYFENKVLTKIVMTDDAAGTKTTLKFSKWNKTTI